MNSGDNQQEGGTMEMNPTAVDMHSNEEKLYLVSKGEWLWSLDCYITDFAVEPSKDVPVDTGSCVLTFDFSAPANPAKRSRMESRFARFAQRQESLKRQAEEKKGSDDNGKKVEMEDASAPVPTKDENEKRDMSEAKQKEGEPSLFPQIAPVEQNEVKEEEIPVTVNPVEVLPTVSPIPAKSTETAVSPIPVKSTETSPPQSNLSEVTTPLLHRSLPSDLPTPVSDSPLPVSKDAIDLKERELSSSPDSFLGGDTTVIQPSSLAHIRQLHTANRRQSILFDQSHARPQPIEPLKPEAIKTPEGVQTPSQVLMGTAAVTLPTALLQRLKTDVVKYTEADLLIERKRVALESKRESEEALAVMEDMLKKEKEKIVAARVWGDD